MTEPTLRAPDLASPPDTPGVRALKIAIVVMGIMIVAGLLTIIGRMVYLGSGGGKQASVSASNSRLPANAKLALPAGAIVKQVVLAGDRLAVHYEAPGSSAIAIFDLATGTALSRVEIVPELPK